MLRKRAVPRCAKPGGFPPASIGALRLPLHDRNSGDMIGEPIFPQKLIYHRNKITSTYYARINIYAKHRRGISEPCEEMTNRLERRSEFRPSSKNTPPGRAPPWGPACPARRSPLRKFPALSAPPARPPRSSPPSSASGNWCWHRAPPETPTRRTPAAHPPRAPAPPGR